MREFLLISPRRARPGVHPKESVSKTGICEALHGLNQGVEQVIRSLTVLQRAGLDLPFINGQKILMEEMKAAANRQIIERMTEREREVWASYKKNGL
jgi:hypothetical protein